MGFSWLWECSPATFLRDAGSRESAKSILGDSDLEEGETARDSARRRGTSSPVRRLTSVSLQQAGLNLDNEFVGYKVFLVSVVCVRPAGGDPSSSRNAMTTKATRIKLATVAAVIPAPVRLAAELKMGQGYKEAGGKGATDQLSGWPAG